MEFKKGRAMLWLVVIDIRFASAMTHGPADFRAGHRIPGLPVQLVDGRCKRPFRIRKPDRRNHVVDRPFAIGRLDERGSVLNVEHLVMAVFRVEDGIHPARGVIRARCRHDIENFLAWIGLLIRPVPQAQRRSCGGRQLLLRRQTRCRVQQQWRCLLSAGRTRQPAQ